MSFKLSTPRVPVTQPADKMMKIKNSFVKKKIHHFKQWRAKLWTTSEIIWGAKSSQITNERS